MCERLLRRACRSATARSAGGTWRGGGTVRVPFRVQSNPNLQLFEVANSCAACQKILARDFFDKLKCLPERIGQAFCDTGRFLLGLRVGAGFLQLGNERLGVVAVGAGRLDHLREDLKPPRHDNGRHI